MKNSVKEAIKYFFNLTDQIPNNLNQIEQMSIEKKETFLIENIILGEVKNKNAIVKQDKSKTLIEVLKKSEYKNNPAILNAFLKYVLNNKNQFNYLFKNDIFRNYVNKFLLQEKIETVIKLLKKIPGSKFGASGGTIQSQREGLELHRLSKDIDLSLPITNNKLDKKEHQKRMNNLIDALINIDPTNWKTSKDWKDSKSKNHHIFANFKYTYSSNYIINVWEYAQQNNEITIDFSRINFLEKYYESIGVLELNNEYKLEEISHIIVLKIEYNLIDKIDALIKIAKKQRFTNKDKERIRHLNDALIFIDHLKDLKSVDKESLKSYMAKYPNIENFDGNLLLLIYKHNNLTKFNVIWNQFKEIFLYSMSDYKKTKFMDMLLAINLKLEILWKHIYELSNNQYTVFIEAIDNNDVEVRTFKYKYFTVAFKHAYKSLNELNYSKKIKIIIKDKDDNSIWSGMSKKLKNDLK